MSVLSFNRIVPYLMYHQFVETPKGWTKGFTFVYLDKKTPRIKHTMSKSKGSKLYTKNYQKTINYFLKMA
jgi:hypothetical protein